MPNQKITEQEQERYIALQKIALDFAREGKTHDLFRMIDAGMPVDLADEKGQTLLMLASYNGHFETTEMLLKKDATVDKKNDRRQTPLGGVAFKGYPDIAELLIENGADINANNGGGMTPIHYATMFGQQEVITVLEKHEASISGGKLHRGAMPFIAKLVGQIRQLFF